MSNADKIVWGPASINELKRALGLVESQDDDVEYDEYLGLEPPWPIVVSSQSAIIGSDGSSEITAVLTFDEVEGATGYQVRISPAEDFDVVDMPEHTAHVSDVTDSYTFEGSNYYEHTATLTQTVEAGDVALIIGPAHTQGYTGAFSTWTEIYGGYDSDPVGSLGIWMGTGVGTGSAVVCTPGPGTLTDQSYFIVIHLKAVTALTQSAFQSTYFANIDEGMPEKVLNSPTVSGPNGKLILTAVRSDGGLSNRVAANGYWLDTGFYGKYYRNVNNSTSNAFYNNGVACSIGVALGNSVSTKFGVWVDGTSADGETATFVFTMG